MKKIASFTVNHDTLRPGIYLSREDGGVITYDLRFCVPNVPPFVDQPSLHTIEHLMATLLRNSEYTDNVIYFGPMGCRTGFYLLTRGLEHECVIELVLRCAKMAAQWDEPIPGAAAPRECGNWLEHDLAGAKEWLSRWLVQVEGWNAEQLVYPE